jgi:predicted membrane channel-forming protein YqfA (hemolysin III family)
MHRTLYVINTILALVWIFAAYLSINMQISYLPLTELIKVFVSNIFIISVFVISALSFKYKNWNKLHKLAYIFNILLITRIVVLLIDSTVTDFDIEPDNGFFEDFIMLLIVHSFLFILPAAFNIKGLRSLS